MLLAGTATLGLGAQAAAPAAPGEPAPARTPAVQERPDPARTGPAEQAPSPSQGAPPKMEFRDAAGNPLPADVQRQLEEEFRKNPLPTTVARPPASAGRNGDVVVTGQRPRGSVIGDIPPERTLSPHDIQAFGASNVEELIEALGPQVGSEGGREDSGPVTLLNGRRVSDFSEIARIPTEAIQRTDIFPEEVALKYGYRADQKVVNIVTFPRFSLRTGQLTYARSPEGGRDAPGIAADYFAIQGDTRYTFGVDYSRSGALLESERDILQASDGPDLGRFRTLLPQAEQLALNGLVSGNPLDGVSSTLNARFRITGAESLLGPGGDGPLRRDSETRTLQLGTTQNGRVGQWLWTLTGAYDRISTNIQTDTGGAVGRRDAARSVNALFDADLVIAGPVLELPAGPLFASVRGGFDIRDFKARSRRAGVEDRTELSRDRGGIQVNLDLPVAGRSKGGLGSLSVNANLAVERLSDFGTLRTVGYGLSWSPIDEINLIASVTDEQGAPRVEQLGAPLVETPNLRTFDFTRREVVDVTGIFGGNPDLRSDERHVVKLGLNARPLSGTDLTLSVDYSSTRIDDPIASFPISTPQIEAAFPERFTRGNDGRLLRIDSRPLNFLRSEQEQLRWGVDFTRPLGPVPSGMKHVRTRFFGSEAEMQRTLPPGARIIKAEPGSALARQAENTSSRLFLSLYHSWTLKDAIVPRDGAPTLDLLDGGAIDFRSGRRRHKIEFQGGAFKRGLGARVTVDWQSGTSVQGMSGDAGDLRFAGLATVNLNLFANLADRFGGIAARGWLKGTRATVGVTNLFNTRPRARDETGSTPLSYQAAYLDPVGRQVFASLRKVF